MLHYAVVFPVIIALPQRSLALATVHLLRLESPRSCSSSSWCCSSQACWWAGAQGYEACYAPRQRCRAQPILERARHHCL